MSRWETEKEILARVRRGEYRVVRSAKRRRKLARRGDYCWWSNGAELWIWEPKR